MNLSYLLGSLRTWKWYRYFLIFQLLIIIGIICFQLWSFNKPFDHTIPMILELAITVLFFIEVVLRVLFCWTTFIKNLGNLVDLASLITIIGLYACYTMMFHNEYNFRADERLPFFLLGGRYFVQIARILFGLASCQSVRKAAKMVFNLDESDDEGGRKHESLLMMDD